MSSVLLRQVTLVMKSGTQKPETQEGITRTQ